MHDISYLESVYPMASVIWNILSSEKKISRIYIIHKEVNMNKNIKYSLLYIDRCVCEKFHSVTGKRTYPSKVNSKIENLHLIQINTLKKYSCYKTTSLHYFIDLNIQSDLF